MIKRPLRKTIATAVNRAIKSEHWVGNKNIQNTSTPEEDSVHLAPVLDEGNLNSDDANFKWNVLDLKRKIAALVNQGNLSEDLLKLISDGSICAPVECEILDYKEKIGDTQYDLGKLVLRIVSFYNSYGGYLVFGIRETESETLFEVIGIDPRTIELEKVKAKVKEFTGERVQLNLAFFPNVNIDSEESQVAVLYIPKRPQSVPPLHFLKDGPGGDAKKPIFRKDDVYHRRGDECVEAKGQRILELNGARACPYAEGENIDPTRFLRITRIPHNLPDRNSICSKFIGRDSTVNALWRWLGDDLSHVKVLAGEGGLGKTSIAFEFAERVSESKFAPFEQVVWLTAKEQQFNGFEDCYFKVPEKHYSTYEELLQAICERLPFTDSELEDASKHELKRMIKKGLMEMPSLIVVDDVDSLSVEEQRQVLELGMILGDSPTRLLLTTRFNQSFSSDTVIRVEGLNRDTEFPAYLESLKERLNISELNNLKLADISKIHSTANGSPLFTESLLRLLRWHSLNDAISLWKNERGTAVRAAALKREVELLTPEAKRVLFTIATLGEASTVELAEVLGYVTETVENSLAELVSLFLVAAPPLASVKRYRVPENTRRLVTDKTTQLVTDRVTLEKEISEFRKKGDRKQNRDTRVAAAILQASSFLKIGELANALATVKDARQRTKDHFDLLSYQAYLNLKETPPKFDDARVNARRAFEKGCVKEEVFHCWFEAEWMAKNFVGAAEAAEAAIVTSLPCIEDWYIRKAAALANKADDQSKAGGVAGAVKTMFEASKLLNKAIQTNKVDEVEWTKRQQEFHDQIWIWGVDENGLAKVAIQIDGLEQMWKLGDTRVTNQRRMLSAIDGMTATLARRIASLSSSQRNLVSTSLNRANHYVERRTLLFPNDSKQKQVVNAWNILRNKAQESISSHDR